MGRGGAGRDRIILFYMDNLIRTGGLFYIKVYEKITAMKEGEGKTEHKSKSQVFVNSPGRFVINNEDWKLIFVALFCGFLCVVD